MHLIFCFIDCLGESLGDDVSLALVKSDRRVFQKLFGGAPLLGVVGVLR